jgi:hypothetical protein
MKLTRAVTHIRLCAVNDAKVAALDALAAEYMGLCQQYVTLFCAEAEPNGYADPASPARSHSAGNASPSSRRLVLPGLGAPTTKARRRTSPTPLPLGRRKNTTPTNGSQSGGNGRHPPSRGRSSRPTPTSRSCSRGRTHRLPIGCGSPRWRRGSRSFSPSHCPPIISAAWRASALTAA